MYRRQSLVMVLALTGACAAAQDADSPPAGSATYETRDGAVVRYVVPAEAMVRDVRFEPGARARLTIATDAPLSRDAGGPLAIEVHFDGGREIAFTRNFHYPASQPFSGAAVLDTITGDVLGLADVELTADGLAITFDGSLVTGTPAFALSRYLPSSDDLAASRRGLARAYATAFLPLRADRPVMTRAVPFAGEARRRDGITEAWGDVHFGPPPGTTNYEPTTPVIEIPSGDGAIEAVDHASDWPGSGDFRTGAERCGAAVLCGWFTWTSHLSFLGGCGPDLDGNGQLDGGEVEHYFGFCAFPSAVNDTWMDRDGDVHWENQGHGDDEGEVYHYIINPTAGELGVWYSTDSGEHWQTQYYGRAIGGGDGWRFFPEPRATPACSE